MTKEEKLAELRNRIPRATCPAGCCICCGDGALVSHSEVRKIIPPDGGICLTGCVWLGAGRRCRVYEERPIRCRLFGMTNDKTSDFYCPDCSGDMSHAEIMAIIAEYEILTADELHTYTGLGQEMSRRLHKDGADKKDSEEDYGQRAGPYLETEVD